jgi:hypothetical protein
VEVVGGAVNVVGAGLDADVDDDDGLGAEISLRLLGGVEFLNGVERQRAGGGAGDAGVVDDGFAVGVVVVGSVDDEIVVVGAVAVGGERVEAAAGITLHAGMKREEILEVAALQGEFVDRLIRKDTAEYGVTGFGERGFVFDFYGFGDRADLEAEIDLDVVAGFDLDAFADELGEALRLDGDGVETWVDAGRCVVAGGVGLDGAADVRGEIFDIDGGIGNGGASGIGHLAAEAALRGCARRPAANPATNITANAKRKADLQIFMASPSNVAQPRFLFGLLDTPAREQRYAAKRNIC